MRSSSKTKTGRFFSRRWVKILAGIAGVIVVLLLLLPLGAKYFLTDWLEKNGADSASIDSLRFNPFKGSVTLQGLDVQVAGKSLLNHSRLEVDIGLGSLFHHDIRLEKVIYQDLNIDLEQYEDGNWRFASYTVTGSASEKTVDSPEDVVSAWAFLADQVVFRNCTIQLKTTDLEATLLIEEAELDDFTTRAGESAATFTFKGEFNGGSIELDLDHLQITPDLRIDGEVALSQIDLSILAPLLKDVLQPFSGVAGLAGKVSFSQSATEGMVVDYDGSIGLIEPNLGNSVFSTRAGQLNWKGKVHYSALSGAPMVVETDGVLSAEKYTLQLPEQDFLLDESGITFDGQTTVEIADTISVVSDSLLDITGTALALPDMKFTEERLVWKGKVQYSSGDEDTGLFVDSTGSLELGSYLFDSRAVAAPLISRGQNLNWQGRLAYGWEKGASETAVVLDGTLLGSELQTILEQQGLQVEEGKFELITKSRIGLAAEPEFSGESSFSLAMFHLFDAKAEASLLTLDSFAINGLQAPGGKKIMIEGLQADGLAASVVGDLPLRVTVPQIELKNIVTDDLASFTAGGLFVKNPLVTAVKNNAEVASLKSLNVEDISLNSSYAVGAQQIQLESLRFLKADNGSDGKAVCTLGNATLLDLSWSKEGGLQGDTLDLNDVVFSIIRDKNGEINISKQLQAMQLQSAQIEPLPQPVVTEKEQSEKSPFKINAIKMTGESGLFFKDYTLAVPFITDLSISKLEVGVIDSSKPDLKTTLLLVGDFEKRAPLEVSGDVSPFLEKPALKMKIKLKNYPLSKLSAYTVQSVGVALAQGQLKFKSTFTLEGDVLDMKNTIVLKKLKTETISKELAEELNNQLPIPLDTALSMLRDNKGNIELDIPLSGPVSDLDVGISDILITALGKAIIPAASSYLVYTLGPYGALAYVGMKVGEKMLQVTLPPVVFVSQESSLSDEHKKYLERVGKILQDRPETDMQICPFVTSWEFWPQDKVEKVKADTIEVDEKERAQLVQLGQDRATVVKTHLVDDYSIDASRLLICNTVIETDKKAVSEVKLQM